MQSNMWDIQRESAISKLIIGCWLNVEWVKLIFISCNGGSALINQHSVPIICYIYFFASLISIYISFRQFYPNGDCCSENIPPHTPRGKGGIFFKKNDQHFLQNYTPHTPYPPYS